MNSKRCLMWIILYDIYEREWEPYNEILQNIIFVVLI